MYVATLSRPELWPVPCETLQGDYRVLRRTWGEGCRICRWMYASLLNTFQAFEVFLDRKRPEGIT